MEKDSESWLPTYGITHGFFVHTFVTEAPMAPKNSRWGIISARRLRLFDAEETHVVMSCALTGFSRQVITYNPNQEIRLRDQAIQMGDSNPLVNLYQEAKGVAPLLIVPQSNLVLQIAHSLVSQTCPASSGQLSFWSMKYDRNTS